MIAQYDALRKLALAAPAPVSNIPKELTYTLGNLLLYRDGVITISEPFAWVIFLRNDLKITEKKRDATRHAVLADIYGVRGPLPSVRAAKIQVRYRIPIPIPSEITAEVDRIYAVWIAEKPNGSQQQAGSDAEVT